MFQGHVNRSQAKNVGYGLKSGRTASSFIALGITKNKPNYTLHYGVDKEK